MGRFVKSLLIGLALALVAAPALAQEAEGGPDLVDALVVNARTPGPAWWSVSKGEAKVWVLGRGAALPASARWDDSAFKRRVKAARRVIYIPDSTSKFKADLRADRDWVAELTDAERARLAQVADLTGRKVAFYAALRPNFAGLMIKTEMDARAKPRRGKAQDLVAKAKGLGATLVPVSGQEAQGIREGLKIKGHDGLTCVRWAMLPRDPVAQHEQRVRAWMQGDVRGLLLGPAAYDPCVQAMSAMQNSMEQGEGAMVEAIAASLDRGQNAVAFVTLTGLLRQGGVLDQLRKRGYRIETPAQLDD